MIVGPVSGLVENFNNGIHSDTINVINVELCVVVLFIELCLFVPLSVTFTILQGHSNVERLLTENFVFLVCSVEILSDCVVSR